MKMHKAFARDRYLIRRKVLKLFGGAFHIYDAEQAQVHFYAEQKAFKLKEAFTVFHDEAKTLPLLTIKARSVIDISATYDICDAQTGDTVGAVRRKGLKSILQDEWEILDANDGVLGHMKEDSVMMALLRRFLSNLIPQNFTFEVGGNVVADLTGTWNPFVVKYDVDLSKNTENQLDSRMALAGTVLLMTIEGKQG